VIRVKAVYHRNDPILTVLPDFKSYPLSSYLFLVFCAAGLWNEIEQAGITDITGVWLAEWGLRFFAVIALKQRYGGHARQAAHIALGAREGGYLGRFVVLVDDDIDPSNMADVLWAVSTRCDPVTSIEIATGCWSSPIDPRLPPAKRAAGDFTNSRAIVNACRPFPWRHEFPRGPLDRSRLPRPDKGEMGGTISIVEGPGESNRDRMTEDRRRKTADTETRQRSPFLGQCSERYRCPFLILGSLSKKLATRGNWRACEKRWTRITSWVRYVKPLMKGEGRPSSLREYEALPCL
jgi:3-polyprenyl-4-hydroxybenzoate decarboxylase